MTNDEHRERVKAALLAWAKNAACGLTKGHGAVPSKHAKHVKNAPRRDPERPENRNGAGSGCGLRSRPSLSVREWGEDSNDGDGGSVVRSAEAGADAEAAEATEGKLT